MLFSWVYVTRPGTLTAKLQKSHHDMSRGITTRITCRAAALSVSGSGATARARPARAPRRAPAALPAGGADAGASARRTVVPGLAARASPRRGGPARHRPVLRVFLFLMCAESAGAISQHSSRLGENNTSSIFHKSAPLVRVVMETNASQSRHMRENSFYWLGESKSSEPRRLAGLSVPRHAGVLARSKISGSLLHRLSRPWHGLAKGCGP